MVSRNNVYRPRGTISASRDMYVEAEFGELGHALGFLEGLVVETDRHVEDLVRIMANRTAEELPAQIDRKPNHIRHVYEFNKVGRPDGRLYEILVRREGVGDKRTRTIDYRFKASTEYVPKLTERYNLRPALNRADRTRHIFRFKAGVMESGMTVKVRPKNAKSVVIPLTKGGVGPNGANYAFNRYGVHYSFAKYRGRFSAAFLVESQFVANRVGRELVKEIETGTLAATTRVGKTTSQKNLSLSIRTGYTEAEKYVASWRNRK